MPRYKVLITEVRSRYIYVDADNFAEAWSKAKSKDGVAKVIWVVGRPRPRKIAEIAETKKAFEDGGEK